MICFHPFDVKNPRTGHFIQVPCGHCPACYHNRQKESAFRYMMESKYAKGLSYFITLTFDDALISFNPNLSRELSKPFASKFINLIRRRFDYHNLGPLRFALVGEYGELYNRAHYHLCLFDVPFNYKDMYTFMSSCWKYGFISVSAFSDARAMYVGKYTCKSLFDDCPFEQKPFLFQSNHLGKAFLKDESSIKMLREQQRFYVTSSNGSAFNLPRYYRNRIFSAHEVYLRNKFLELSKWQESFKPSFYGSLKSKIRQQSSGEELFYKRLREARNL